MLLSFSISIIHLIFLALSNILEIFLQERTSSPAAFTRATVVIAVKYSIVERQEKIDEILYPEISTFLMLIKDQDRVIVRNPL